MIEIQLLAVAYNSALNIIIITENILPYNPQIIIVMITTCDAIVRPLTKTFFYYSQKRFLYYFLFCRGFHYSIKTTHKHKP